MSLKSLGSITYTGQCDESPCSALQGSLQDVRQWMHSEFEAGGCPEELSLQGSHLPPCRRFINLGSKGRYEDSHDSCQVEDYRDRSRDGRQMPQKGIFWLSLEFHMYSLGSLE